jgi:hypothetical protein
LPLLKKVIYTGLISSDEYFGIFIVNGVQLDVRQDAVFFAGDVVLLTGASKSAGVMISYDNIVVYKPWSENQPIKK